MARKKDTPQKAALREMMGNYLKENKVKVIGSDDDPARIQIIVQGLGLS